MEEVFTEIYDKNKWGGGSGTGSKMSRNNQKYIDILNEILNKYNIKTICDIGCGDWQFSKFIKYNTKDINYLGIDCVKSVIDNNLKDYKDTNINFEHKTISDKYIPENYDLIISNPPIHDGEALSLKVSRHLIEEAKRLLDPDVGELWIVSQISLPLPYLVDLHFDCEFFENSQFLICRARNSRKRKRNFYFLNIL